MNTQNTSNRPIIEVTQYSAKFCIKQADMSPLVVVMNAEELTAVEEFFARKATTATSEADKIFFDCVRTFCYYAKRHGAKLLEICEWKFGVEITLGFSELEELLTFQNMKKTIIDSVMMK